MTTEIEFRPATDDEMGDLQRIGSYVFAEPPGNDQQAPLLAPWTQCAFDGDQMVATSGAYPFILRLNGNTAPMHGVTMVGTEPAYRRRGIVRRMITDLLHRGREEGQVGSILLASMGAIYQRFGYGLASAMVRYQFDPKEAAFQQSVADEGYCRRLEKDDAFPAIKSVFRDYMKHRNMMALRADVVWERILNGDPKTPSFFVVHFNSNDIPDGYCVYSTRYYDRPDSGPDQELTVQDFAYSDMHGYRGIWNYLRSHDLVGRVVWGNVPEDDPAPGLLLEPRCLNRKVGDGIWFRPIDLAGLLAARGYDVDGEVTLAVRDDELCPWNNQVYRLTVSDGEAAVETGEWEADLSCSVNSLGSLISGYSSASYLSRIGRIEAAREDGLPRYDALFSTRYRPVLSFGF